MPLLCLTASGPGEERLPSWGAEAGSPQAPQRGVAVASMSWLRASPASDLCPHHKAGPTPLSSWPMPLSPWEASVGGYLRQLCSWQGHHGQDGDDGRTVTSGPTFSRPTPLLPMPTSPLPLPAPSTPALACSLGRWPVPSESVWLTGQRQPAARRLPPWSLGKAAFPLSCRPVARAVPPAATEPCLGRTRCRAEVWGGVPLPHS